MKVLILAHQELVPPQKATKKERQKADWKVEFDVEQALEKLNYETQFLGIGDELSVLRKELDFFKPHIVFNLLEDFHGIPLFDQNVVSYLELKKIAYTGCNPRGLMISRDKSLMKKILSYHGILTPQFQVYKKGRKIKREHSLTYPLIVKSMIEESSTGISQASVVTDSERLIERIQFIHETVKTDALVEEYIEGRELYVGMIGNERTTTFPVWELYFGSDSTQIKPIATHRVKWSEAYRKKHKIRSRKAPLNEEQRELINKVCKSTYQILSLNGYARLDLRMTQEGKVYLIEANPNPHLAKDEDFAESAKAACVAYEDLIKKIVKTGQNWDPYWYLTQCA